MPNLKLTILDQTFIIAEVGINHNGDLAIAKKLIDMAKQCGCDAVKFQKRSIDIVYTKNALDEKRESPWGTTQREQKEGLEFSEKEYWRSTPRPTRLNKRASADFRNDFKRLYNASHRASWAGYPSPGRTAPK